MTLHMLIAVAAASVAPATKAEPATSRMPGTVTVEVKPPEAKKPAVDPMAAMAAMMKMFDKFLPASPEPDPVRLSVARGTALTMFPNGAYAEAMTGFLDRTAERVLAMSEADLAAMFPEDAGEKKKSKKPLSTEPLRMKLAREEPNFDAKFAAIRAFAGTMLTKLGNAAEPKFREGMARAMARKFDSAQLAEINAFLATRTGASYGRHAVGMWFEPDVMRGMFEMFPEMVKMMPELAEDAASLDTQIKAKPKAGKK